MISYSDALEHLLSEAKIESDYEVKELKNAIGQILYEDISASAPYPAFNTSAMDGFALSSESLDKSLHSAGAVLPVSDMIAAGDSAKVKATDKASAIEIMTGAPLPDGFDTVIKIEDVKVLKDSSDKALKIEIAKELKPGANVRLKGEDFGAGTLLIKAGTKLKSRHYLTLLTAGIGSVKVRPKASVSLLSTGSELVEAKGLKAEALTHGKIFNSTGPFLESFLSEAGVALRNFGFVEDETELFKARFTELLDTEADIIVTTGAVSKGRFDFIPDLLKEFSFKKVFHGVAIKPGKPIMFGMIETKTKRIPLFALPGNPLSVLTGARFFLLPFLRSMQGLKQEEAVMCKAVNGYKKRKGKDYFVLGNISNQERSIKIIPKQDSFMVTPLMEANAFAMLGADKEYVEAGTELRCYPLLPNVY